jgi:hypothetical protein
LDTYEQITHIQEKDNDETFERVDEPMVNIDVLGKWLSQNDFLDSIDNLEQ